MGYAILILLLLCKSVWAFDDDPRKPFDATKNYFETVRITWKPVADVQKSCALEYSRRRMVKLTWSVDACSYWVKDECTIITKIKPNMHDVGHEVRHCFQRDWH